MGMSKESRRLENKKRTLGSQLKSGAPNVNDLREGGNEFRSTSEGVVEYIKLNNILYKKVLEPVNVLSKAQSIVQVPNYDSGWIAVSNSSNYDFIHNLKTKMLSLQIYIKDSSDRIFIAKDLGMYGGNYEGGISVYMESDDKINIGTGNDAILTYDNTTLGTSYANIASGYIRVLAWKIEGL